MMSFVDDGVGAVETGAVLKDFGVVCPKFCDPVTDYSAQIRV
jgi:hypothetical protein